MIRAGHVELTTNMRSCLFIGLVAFSLSCGQTAGMDGGVDSSAAEAGSDALQDVATDSAEASTPCKGYNARCVNPDECCGKLCSFIIGDEAGACK